MKERGISATTVSGVMGGAGMTVGGFYAHFSSKDDLVAQSLSSALCQSIDILKMAAGDKTGSDWLKAVSRSYLSRAHRDNPSAGCPLPATAAEISNAADSVRCAFSTEVDAIVGEIAAHEEEAGLARPHEEALAVLAMMVGGMTLARALKGTPQSDEVLKACRDHIESCLKD